MAKNISKTLIVGLGGTGQTVICDIKKRMLRTYGEIPPLVKFLAIDTDNLKDFDGMPFRYYYDGHVYEDFKCRIERNEFLKLPCPHMEVIREDVTCQQKLDLDQLDRVVSRFGGYGAGGSRVLGRAHLLNAAHHIIQTLAQPVAHLRNVHLGMNQIARGYNVLHNDITVYVVASLAGGTGSSAVMDISRMLQIAGINVHYDATFGQDKIFGVFFLPRFFDDRPCTPYTRMNAYTALSELDYVIGLGDPMRHDPASKEVQEDIQDYNGFPNNGKRVVYSSIYLIDALTDRGNINRLHEASANVASFIAASIAVDNTSLMSSYVNSTHKWYCVKGKYQYYSSLGYCELRFIRQDLVRYLLNKKLLGYLQEFKAGAQNTTSNLIVEEFLYENHLNEGVMCNAEGQDTRAQLNQLTDSIIDMTDRRLTGTLLMDVDPGRRAADDVAMCKYRYLTIIGTVAQEMVTAFANRKKNLLQNLRSLLDNHISGLGFGTFPELVWHLRAAIADMKRGLEEEMMQHEKLFERIERRELPQLQDMIAEKFSSFLFFLGNKRLEQQELIFQYLNKVRFDTSTPQNPTLAWLKVETIRKREAVAVYEEMLNIIDSYYKEETIETLNGFQTNVTGAYNYVHSLYRTLKEQLIRENNNYRPSKTAVNETVFADAYFKEYFDEHDDGSMVLNMQAMTALNDYFASVFADRPQDNEATLTAMREKLLSLLPANGIIRRIQAGEATIEELFIWCFGSYGDINDTRDLENNPQLRLLAQVRHALNVMWSYQFFGGQGMRPEKHIVVGVCDANNDIFLNHGYNAAIDGWNNYSYVTLGDPDRIAFMPIEAAIPAFKLIDADGWAKEFEQRKNDVYTFSDKRLEEIDMLMPCSYEEAKIAWAYGWLFGLIANPTGRRGLCVKPSTEYAEKHSVELEQAGTYYYFASLKNSSDISACHRKFIRDSELSMDIYRQVMLLLEKDPVGSIAKLKQWVNEGQMWAPEVRGKQEFSMTEEERKVIQDEISYLEKRFDILGPEIKLVNGKIEQSPSET